MHGSLGDFSTMVEIKRNTKMKTNKKKKKNTKHKEQEEMREKAYINVYPSENIHKNRCKCGLLRALFEEP